MTTHVRLGLIVLYAVSLLVNAGVIYWARQRNLGHLGRVFTAAAAMTLAWNLFAFLRFMTPVYGGKLFLFHLKYVFQWGTAVGWFVFALHYTGREHLLTRRAWLVIGAFVGGSMVVAFTNPWHGLVWADYAIATDPFPHLVTTNNAAYWVMLAIGYSFPLAASAILLATMFRSRRISQHQTLALGLAFVLATVVHAGQSLDLFPTAGYDYISIVTTAIGAIIAYTLLRRSLLVVQPVSRTDVMESVDEAIIVVTDDRLVADYNETATGIFPGLERGTGSKLGDAAPRLVDDDGSIADEIDLSGSIGPRKYVVEAEAISDHGRHRGHTIVVRDVTKVEEYAENLERQTEQLDEIAGFVSHDLRNPLAVAKAYLHDLDGDVDDDRLETVAEALDRMDDMIDDSLTLAREGRAIEEQYWEPLAEIVDDAWDTSDTAAATIEHDVTEDARIYADGARLRTLLENLFRNAVDHGPDDVTVHVGLLDDRDGFYVADDGPGIPPERRDEAFQRGVSFTDGTGLGLSIVESIAHAHGWRVEMGESAEGGVRLEVVGVDTRDEADTEEQATAES